MLYRSNKIKREIAPAVLMFKPHDFKYDEETIKGNDFAKDVDLDPSKVVKQAFEEFDNMVKVLRDNGVEVIVFDKSLHPELKDIVTPNAMFPSNWLLTEPSDLMYTFRVKDEERRLEKKYLPYVEDLLLKNGFNINGIMNLGSERDTQEEFLESTGSMIFDRNYNLVYTNFSHRTTEKALQAFLEITKYDCVAFNAVKKDNEPIYHTDLVLAVGQGYVIVCLEAVKANQRGLLLSRIRNTGKEVITITRDQALRYGCANVLELATNDEHVNVLVMSERAYNAYTPTQKETLENYVKLVPVKLDIIESAAGGSARCLLCEIFLTKQSS